MIMGWSGRWFRQKERRYSTEKRNVFSVRRLTCGTNDEVAVFPRNGRPFQGLVERKQENGHLILRTGLDGSIPRSIAPNTAVILRRRSNGSETITGR